MITKDNVQRAIEILEMFRDGKPFCMDLGVGDPVQITSESRIIPGVCFEPERFHEGGEIDLEDFICNGFKGSF